MPICRGCNRDSMLIVRASKLCVTCNTLAATADLDDITEKQVMWQQIIGLQSMLQELAKRVERLEQSR